MRIHTHMKPHTSFPFEKKVLDGYAAVRSSSRVGDSDFSVNAKRLNYIAEKLRAKGWDAPGVKG
jgi:uncharacterized protein (DUF1499 family)